MKTTILVMEDSPEVRENISEILELAGYRVLTAQNGKEGVDIIAKEVPDLILSDIMMPEMDGYKVLELIRTMPKMIGVPFIFLTAKSSKNDFRAGMDHGADDYITKPFTSNELLKIVSSRLKKREEEKRKFGNSIEGLGEILTMIENANINIESKHVKKIRAKEFVFMEGDTINFIYYVISGKVKSYKTNDVGKEYIIEFHQKGDFIGYSSLFEEDGMGNKYTITASAIEDSELLSIPRPEFLKAIFADQKVAMKFMNFISNHLQQAEDRLIKLAYNSSRKRVAEALLFLSKKHEKTGEDKFNFSLTREDISALAAVAPESVSRNLTEFKNEGLINVTHKSVHILNYNKLASLRD